MADTYQKSETRRLNEKLQTLILLLPEFALDFFIGISDTTQIKTRIAYAYDLKIFFNYLQSNCKIFNERENDCDFTVYDLDKVKATDIERFMQYLSSYTLVIDEKENHYSNSHSGKMRKLSSLRSFYKYYYKREFIKNNPALLVDMPKIHEKEIIRLENDESELLLETIEDGTKLSKSQKHYHSKNKKRDLAIISLLLGTGIRVSECVGLDIRDIDFENSSFVVTRKGGNRAILFLPDEVKEYLVDYINSDRLLNVKVNASDSDALFISMQNKRLTARSIEYIVKKYTQTVVPLKNISPHKFRSTFGTNLYQETGDIYLVADVLGHKDINITKKHYAAIDIQRRKVAAKVTKLKKK